MAREPSYYRRLGHLTDVAAFRYPGRDTAEVEIMMDDLQHRVYFQGADVTWWKSQSEKDGGPRIPWVVKHITPMTFPKSHKKSWRSVPTRFSRKDHGPVISAFVAAVKTGMVQGPPRWLVRFIMRLHDFIECCQAGTIHLVPEMWAVLWSKSITSDNYPTLHVEVHDIQPLGLDVKYADVFAMATQRWSRHESRAQAQDSQLAVADQGPPDDIMGDDIGIVQGFVDDETNDNGWRHIREVFGHEMPTRSETTEPVVEPNPTQSDQASFEAPPPDFAAAITTWSHMEP